MAFKVKPFSEVVGLSKELLDEVLAPIRIRVAKAKAAMTIARYEEELVTIERQIYESCAARDINFDMVIGLMDKYELTERKTRQIAKIVDELFPDA